LILKVEFQKDIPASVFFILNQRDTMPKSGKIKTCNKELLAFQKKLENLQNSGMDAFLKQTLPPLKGLGKSMARG